MGNIKPKELSKLGYTDNVARSLAIEMVAKHCKHHTQEDIIHLLQDIIQSPEKYKLDAFDTEVRNTNPLLYNLPSHPQRQKSLRMNYEKSLFHISFMVQTI